MLKLRLLASIPFEPQPVIDPGSSIAGLVTTPEIPQVKESDLLLADESLLPFQDIKNLEKTI